MKTIRHSATLSLVLAICAGHGFAVAEEQEADSVYSYGRWAVLSPAAGGIEPYVPSDMPDAINNTRPCEPFCPDTVPPPTATVVPPPVVDDPRDRPPPPSLPPPIAVVPLDDPRDRPPPPPF